jgi:hypothetical protein
MRTLRGEEDERKTIKIESQQSGSYGNERKALEVPDIFEKHSKKRRAEEKCLGGYSFHPAVNELSPRSEGSPPTPR